MARENPPNFTHSICRRSLIENRPGASGNIGANAVVRAAPDGYTLLLVAPTTAINATLYENLNFNFIRDIAPVASIIRSPNVMLVHPSVPANERDLAF